MIVFGATPLAVAWNDGELLEAAIWFGAGGRVLLRLAGAAFGIIADAHRVTAYRLYGELARRSKPAP